MNASLATKACMQYDGASQQAEPFGLPGEVSLRLRSADTRLSSGGCLSACWLAVALAGGLAGPASHDMVQQLSLQWACTQQSATAAGKSGCMPVLSGQHQRECCTGSSSARIGQAQRCAYLARLRAGPVRWVPGCWPAQQPGHWLLRPAHHVWVGLGLAQHLAHPAQHVQGVRSAAGIDA